MDTFCGILAALNAIEAMFCAADWYYTPNVRNAVIWATWLGSTLFWIVRGMMQDC